MRIRIALWALAIGFYAAPISGAVARDACSPCCPQPADAPCETGQAPCTSLGAAPCCDVTPVAPLSHAKPSIDPPAPHPVVASVLSEVAVPSCSRAPRLSEDLAPLTSPLRLSVVLRI